MRNEDIVVIFAKLSSSAKLKKLAIKKKATIINQSK